MPRPTGRSRCFPLSGLSSAAFLSHGNLQVTDKHRLRVSYKLNSFTAWNTGTCLFMAWTGLACLNSFVNSIVWNGNVINWAPVWCDISRSLSSPHHCCPHLCFRCSNLHRYQCRNPCYFPLYSQAPLPNYGHQKCHDNES